jgi:hypothetical protein
MQNENKTEIENINVVGVKVLEQNGINVDEIIKLLVYNASVEFTAYYYFTNKSKKPFIFYFLKVLAVIIYIYFI